jgi:hypothetical protein
VEETLYYQHADGSLSKRTVVADVEGPIRDPEGVVRIGQLEYESGVEALKAARDAVRAERDAAEEALRQQAYEALTAAGMPQAAAQLLSGLGPGLAVVAPGGD